MSPQDTLCTCDITLFINNNISIYDLIYYLKYDLISKCNYFLVLNFSYPVFSYRSGYLANNIPILKVQNYINLYAKISHIFSISSLVKKSLLIELHLLQAKTIFPISYPLLLSILST